MRSTMDSVRLYCRSKLHARFVAPGQFGPFNSPAEDKCVEVTGGIPYSICSDQETNVKSI